MEDTLVLNVLLDLPMKMVSALKKYQTAPLTVFTVDVQLAKTIIS